MYVILWEYEVRAGCEADFETAYASGGAWVRFFEAGEGYRGTELLRHSGEPRRYATIDRWDSAAHYTRFRDAHEIEYQELDEQFEKLTEREALIGAYEVVTS